MKLVICLSFFVFIYALGECSFKCSFLLNISKLWILIYISHIAFGNEVFDLHPYSVAYVSLFQDRDKVRR